jgi:hypothetical protein
MSQRMRVANHINDRFELNYFPMWARCGSRLAKNVNQSA